MPTEKIIWSPNPPTESFTWPIDWHPRAPLPISIIKDLEHDLSWRRNGRSPEEVARLLQHERVCDEWFLNLFESDQQRSDYDILNTHPTIKWRKQIMITVNPEWIFMHHITQFDSITDWAAAQLLR